MASTDVLSISDYSPHSSKLLTYGALWYPGSGTGDQVKGAGQDRPQSQVEPMPLPDSSFIVLSGESQLQLQVATSRPQSSTCSHNSVEESHTDSQHVPGVRAQDCHSGAWPAVTLRCRDVHCSSSKISDGLMASSCAVYRGKCVPRLSSGADYNPSTLRTLPAEHPSRSAAELDSMNPPLEALQEGLIAFGKSQLGDFHGFKLDFSPRLSAGDSDVTTLQFLPDLLQSALPATAQERRDLEAFRGNSEEKVLTSAGGSSRESSLRSSSEESCQDPCRGVGSPQMTRDDGTEGLVEEEKSPLLAAAGLPRTKSILKFAVGEGDGGRERGSKTVTWRDGHGDNLVAVREFEVSDQLEFYEEYGEAEQGFCAGCCTVS